MKKFITVKKKSYIYWLDWEEMSEYYVNILQLVICNKTKVQVKGGETQNLPGTYTFLFFFSSIYTSKSPETGMTWTNWLITSFVH